MAVKEKEHTDFEIIDRILQGERNAYELLIRKYNQRLYRVAKGILWEEEIIEDAMQDAYIKAYQQLAGFQKKSTFSTWITRILINECLMIKRHSTTGVNTEDSSVHSDRLVDFSNPERKTINNELKVLLEGAIQQLPDKYRTVFILRELENMSVMETSRSLEITETNVKARLSRAKEMLRDNLTSNMPVGDLLEFNLIRCDRIVKNVLMRI